MFNVQQIYEHISRLPNKNRTILNYFHDGDDDPDVASRHNSMGDPRNTVHRPLTLLQGGSSRTSSWGLGQKKTPEGV